MLKLYDTGVYYLNGELFTDPQAVQVKTGTLPDQAECAKNTMAYGILKAHNHGSDMEHMNLKFDSITSHDITYVGIIQTARLRDEAVPSALCSDQLPQLPVRRGRHYQ